MHPGHGTNSVDDLYTSSVNFDFDEMRNFLHGLSKIHDIDQFYGVDEEPGLAFRNPDDIDVKLTDAENDTNTRPRVASRMLIQKKHDPNNNNVNIPNWNNDYGIPNKKVGPVTQSSEWTPETPDEGATLVPYPAKLQSGETDGEEGEPSNKNYFDDYTPGPRNPDFVSVRTAESWTPSWNNYKHGSYSQHDRSRPKDLNDNSKKLPEGIANYDPDGMWTNPGNPNWHPNGNDYGNPKMVPDPTYSNTESMTSRVVTGPHLDARGHFRFEDPGQHSKDLDDDPRNHTIDPKIWKAENPNTNSDPRQSLYQPAHTIHYWDLDVKEPIVKPTPYHAAWIRFKEGPRNPDRSTYPSDYLGPYNNYPKQASSDGPYDKYNPSTFGHTPSPDGPFYEDPNNAGLTKTINISIGVAGEFRPRQSYEGVSGLCHVACTGLCYLTCYDVCTENCDRICWARCGNACIATCGNQCSGCFTLCQDSCHTKCVDEGGFACQWNGSVAKVPIATHGKTNPNPKNSGEYKYKTCEGSCQWTCQYYPNYKTQCWDTACMTMCVTTCRDACLNSCHSGCINLPSKVSGDDSPGTEKGSPMFQDSNPDKGCQYICTHDCSGDCSGADCASGCSACIDDCTTACDSSCNDVCDIECDGACSLRCNTDCNHDCGSSEKDEPEGSVPNDDDDEEEGGED
jgi:hypothetical protein